VKQSESDNARSGKLTGGSLRTVVLSIVAVIVMGIAAAAVLYVQRVAPFRTAVLEVDGSSVTMQYFLKRASVTPGNSSQVLQALVNDELVNQMAPGAPYNIRVTENDLDLFLREAAGGEIVSEEEFDSWYGQRLEETPYSEAEYRAVMRTNLLRRRLAEYLAERIPTVAEHVLLFMIVQDSIDDAGSVKQRLDAGEDFFALSQEVNVDDALRARNGEFGWYPREALPENVARVVFDELEPGQFSEPIPVNRPYYAVMVVANREARQVDETALQTLRSNALERWLDQELLHHNVVVHGLKNGYDEETDAWVQWQLQKMRK